ncbi:MAG: hypothetical protein JXB32_18215 [Deltaproteobacteria bacterium]|nr:hypothetical protein [Deltaproteobacteria bacterium]
MSRVRSLISSRSYCANESSRFSMSFPCEVAVLNSWVAEAKSTLHRSSRFQIS